MGAQNARIYTIDESEAPVFDPLLEVEDSSQAVEEVDELTPQILEGIPIPANTDSASFEQQTSNTEFNTLLEAQLRFRDLLDQDRDVEAASVAERIVELTQEVFGSESSEAALSISNLAEAQRRAGLYEDSTQNFLASVELLRANEGAFTQSVIQPLVGLGASYNSLGAYPEAVAVFREARTVNRRVFGLLNEGQIPILDRLANALVSMQLYSEAEDQKLEGMRIMFRTLGTDNIEILPTLYKYARWLRRTYRFIAERAYYQRAIEIIREIEGRDSALLAHPLREIGNSLRVQKYTDGRGISSLRRALAILEEQPEPDKLELARTLRDMGDWDTAFGFGGIGDEYQEAWALLDEVEDGERVQRRWFYEPRYVFQENPSTRGLTSIGTPGAQQGHVLVTFDVTTNGRTANVEVVESQPPGFKDEAAIRALIQSRFRPRMVDGEIIEANGLVRDFTFLYMPESGED
ncbi:MAG: TonB family protein [Pseudomonadota bacterium]|nr:TonB family protein [Pseudomonadota bacterium]